jgi:hypothetical protein
MRTGLGSRRRLSVFGKGFGLISDACLGADSRKWQAHDREAAANSHVV